jgi:Orotidine 5'-phosphate decarboxylase / HUMPS family
MLSCSIPADSAISKCTGAYTEAVAAAAAQHEDFVMGFISISPSQWSGPAPSPGLIHMTPGVQLQVGALPCPLLPGVTTGVETAPAADCR